MRSALLIVLLAVVTAMAQTPSSPLLDEETLRHFQALLRIDTTDPPGNEKPAADYLKQVLEGEGIPARSSRWSRIGRISSRASRATARSGRCSSWATPTPSTSTRRSGRIRRSAPRATAATSTAAAPSTTRTTSSPALMTMLMLKRLNVPLDRDVIFLAEAGEEGTTRVGIQFMANQHFPQIDAEYCFAEGGSVHARRAGR